jgi:hypothetical protein
VGWEVGEGEGEGGSGGGLAAQGGLVDLQSMVHPTVCFVHCCERTHVCACVCSVCMGC